jgi:hypothetical protein
MKEETVCLGSVITGLPGTLQTSWSRRINKLHREFSVWFLTQRAQRARRCYYPIFMHTYRFQRLKDALANSVKALRIEGITHNNFDQYIALASYG